MSRPSGDGLWWNAPKDLIEAQDDLENVAAVISFLSGTLATGRDDSGSDLPLSERGQHGLWLILGLVENHVDLINQLIGEIKPQTA